MSQDHTLRKTQVLLQHYQCALSEKKLSTDKQKPSTNIKMFTTSSPRLLHRRSHCEDRHRPANRSRLRLRATASRRTRSSQSARTCRRLANQPPPPPPLWANRSLRRSSASADSTRRNTRSLTRPAWAVDGRSVLILIQEKLTCKAISDGSM